MIGLVGLLSPNYMAGTIEVGPYKGMIKSFLDLDRDLPDTLKMADFGLFRLFSFSIKSLYYHDRKVKTKKSLELEVHLWNSNFESTAYNKYCHQVCYFNAINLVRC